MTKEQLIAEIKDRPLQGYLWLGNETAPEVYFDQAVDLSLFERENKFVAEGLLYDKDKGRSYQIKFVGGGYQINGFPSSPLQDEGEVATPKTYIPHRIKGAKGLKFNQIYKPLKDTLCIDMPVMKLDRVTFTGFEK